MTMKQWWLAAMAAFMVVSGCAKEETEQKQSLQGADLMRAQTSGTAKGARLDQGPAERAAAYLRQRRDIRDVVVVNSGDRLLVAYQIPHMQRWNRKKIEKDVEDRLRDMFPGYQVVSSSDLKIFWKTQQLKTKMVNKRWDQREVNREIGRIEKLSKEQT
ncbi:sporulation protein [Geobacillus subterraneus]|uniref:Sporulation protein n=2 Tax=Geobacillus TaxID=129337 RepID=A0ABM6AFP5_9BACL|nr:MULTISPECIES: YhcN/YlaJ family sporulation lipoprotein [Geobacillus]AMX85232.1 sporulation protein [Geobacillus subterraneus]KZS25298.1 sporulation protein [Geobacillus subterraneus]OXB90259.1 sporulation protein [Geobacillus uzenensis]QIZ68981.1 sporulation protein [Geobacillus subterraneus]WPZ19183.1 YhcN/YlaJ family sporulation lipoprotein [Geobacillus subterraneus]